MRRWLGTGAGIAAAWTVVLVVALALAISWWALSRRGHRPPAAAEPWARLPARTAYEAGLKRIQKGESLESLPYLRRAFTESGGLIWEVPYAIFAALRNLSLAGRERLQRPEPATRSSAERVRLVREALFYLGQAERAAKKPRDIALIRKDRAELLQLWGCGWDAFVSYREAQAADTTWTELARKADAMMTLLERPGGGGS